MIEAVTFISRDGESAELEELTGRHQYGQVLTTQARIRALLNNDGISAF